MAGIGITPKAAMAVFLMYSAGNNAGLYYTDGMFYPGIV